MLTTAKISKDQHETLTKLNDYGVVLVYRQGGAWTTNTTLDVRPGWPVWCVATTTKKALLSRGWIERVANGRSIYDEKYQITDLGRAAINERGNH